MSREQGSSERSGNLEVQFLKAYRILFLPQLRKISLAFWLRWKEEKGEERGNEKWQQHFLSSNFLVQIDPQNECLVLQMRVRNYYWEWRLKLLLTSPSIRTTLFWFKKFSSPCNQRSKQRWRDFLFVVLRSFEVKEIGWRRLWRQRERFLSISQICFQFNLMWYLSQWFWYKRWWGGDWL